MPPVVGVVDPNRTFALRQRVLRPQQSLETVAADNDFPGALSFGASEEETGEILSTSTIYPEEPPRELRPIAVLARTHRPWRLRAVATDARHRSQGLGRLVLECVIAHIASEGDAVLWCYARIPARRFYEREGFDSFGEVFVVPEFGPHVVMYKTIDGCATTSGLSEAAATRSTPESATALGRRWPRA